jgi:glycerophosphoryl diester phosphodiesterase
MTIWRSALSSEGPSACLVVGHRGGRGEGWPVENSLAAFARAHDEGALAIETDARLTRTGEVVLCHDKDLLHTTGGKDARRVADVGMADLGRLGLARLDETLAWAARTNVAVNVEIKHDVPRRLALCRAVARALASSRADVLLSSFDPSLLGAMAALAPRVPRAWLMHPDQRRTALAVARAATKELVVALHPEHTMLTAAHVERWKKHGLAVGTYTVNEPDEAVRLAALGVDWIITDAPGTILAALSPPGSSPASRPSPPATAARRDPRGSAGST